MPWYEDEKTKTYYFKVNYKEGGKYKQILRRGFRTKKEVKAAMAEVEDQVNKGTFINPSKTPYKVFIEDWLDDKNSSVKPQTLVNYEKLFQNHILPMRENSRGKTVGLGDIEVGWITMRDIQDLYNHLFESKSLSDENIQKCHTLIKASLKQAKKEKMIADNPAEDVDRPTARKKEMQVWTIEEAHQFLKVAAADPLYIVFLLALTTGMRQGEILGLRWKDFDKNTRIISITQILDHKGKNFEVGAKTISGVRPIRLDKDTADTLIRHRTKSREKQMEFADVFEDRDLVVCTRTGGPVSPRNVNRSFDRIVAKINRELQDKRDKGIQVGRDLKKIRFHDLRHTHVTFLIKNRETPQAIAERLGWSDTRMIDNYAHIRPDIQEDVAEAFGQAFYSNGS
ncbi:Site-specific recombinase XerD [Paenibacillus uliginis N3/975]|uniref:Site-specific recombinase XerD n=1 Tax=Paenibacillus uliginis N3/975 TaxID=1313296 RepID=A0A1X7HK54_9BACL|nr:site-specific integrase [Paenibacillus uliginis]SMF88191.1 Site-specific recombinase XerD [Paenibacillus uliginis N3/975]